MVKTCLNAVKAYFEARNQVWVTADFQHLLDSARVSSKSRLVQGIVASHEAKLRAAKQRRGKLLRAHSKVCLHGPERLPEGTEQVLLDERVTWVYRDGKRYNVESRVIRHQQKWALQNGLWTMIGTRESNEMHTRDSKDKPVLGTGLEPAFVRLPTYKHCVSYNRVQALRYAELWWDDYNPSFAKIIQDDCTNFVSQCLFAGGIPMTGGENRTVGWWYKFRDKSISEPWSFSWTTSHGLLMYVANKVGATTVANPKELKIGDLVFYDWDGSGRYHHTTIVTDFDLSGDPLVNAHTDSSYHRHYAYLDSRAWTPRTRYKFVHMPDKYC